MHTRDGRLDPAGWDRTAVKEALTWSNIASDPGPAGADSAGPILVGSTGPFATLAGRYALEAGGSATDAVLTTAFTQVALSLGSWVSYAGMLAMVQYDAATASTSTVSAGFGTFEHETRPQDIPAAPHPSGRTALVPGFVAGAHAAHVRAGRLPWDQLWSPARYLIDRGVPVNAHLQRLLNLRSSVLTRTAEGRAIFAPDGSTPRAGDRLFQPELAATVAAIADQGPGWMYQGPWAEHFVSLVRREGGAATLDDLARYQPLSSRPLRGWFAGHELATLPAPDTGGTELLSTLARLEQAGIGEPTQDPGALVGLLAALGDARAAGSHSDYVVAVDAAGNVATLCHSINTAIWGTTGIVVDGIPISDPAAFQQAALTQLPGGAHLPMPVEPAIAFQDGRPVLAFSSIGAGLHPATVLGAHRVLALGQPLAAAVAAPLVHAHDVVVGDSVTSVLSRRDTGPVSRVLDERFPAASLAAARAAGFSVVARPADDPQLPRGFWAAIAIDPITGHRTAGRTPHGEGPVRAAALGDRA